MTDKRELSGEETRQRILEVAGPLFAQKGYEGVGFRALARQAGVSLNTITYHFGSKQGLYHAVAGRVAEQGIPSGRLLQVVEPVADGDRQAVADAMAALITVLLEHMQAIGDWHTRLVLYLLLEGDRELLLQFLEGFAEADEAVDRLMAKAHISWSKHERLFFLHSLWGMFLHFFAYKELVLADFEQDEAYDENFKQEIVRYLSRLQTSVVGLPLPRICQQGGQDDKNSVGG